MLTHSAIWDSIDALAERHGFSPSGLARIAGLDATAFNKSKRVSKDGRERWPSNERIAKILEATGEGFDQFVASGAYLQVGALQKFASVPLLGLAQAGSGGFFDSAGFPAGQGWDEINLPATNGEDGTYALEVSGDSMLPLYRDGDIIVISPTREPRRGDRVVVRTRDGEVLVKILYRQTPKAIELHSLNTAHPPRIIEMSEIEGIGRIIWASQ